MQSENFDNKIKQAAEQHHPDYDEKAWTKMERLLERHLPQQGHHRRRVIFFALLFLVTGGGLWLIVSKPWQTGDQTLTATNAPFKTDVKQSTGSTKETVGENSPADKRIEKETIATTPAIANEKNDDPITRSAGNQEQNDQDLITNRQADVRIQPKKVLTRQNNNTEQLSIDIVSSEKLKKDKEPSLDNSVISSLNDNSNKPPANEKNKTPVDQPVKTDIAKNNATEPKKDNVTEPANTSAKKEVTKKSSTRKTNSFFFSFSAAPDVSSVGLDNPGKIKLLAGAGFGYTFKDRLTLRTGFYSAHKVYSASPLQYKPDVTPPNPSYIDNIDADCKVYEIPVSLAYNFSQSKRHNLFASAGLSSFIMKKESYVYLYKYPNGSTYSHTKTINNEYKHYFSVLTLSAGYQHKINRTFSISAEPYVKLPLAGVGYGRVKLNSAGVLFSVNIIPFQPSAKK